MHNCGYWFTAAFTCGSLALRPQRDAGGWAASQQRSKIKGNKRIPKLKPIRPNGDTGVQAKWRVKLTTTPVTKAKLNKNITQSIQSIQSMQVFIPGKKIQATWPLTNLETLLKLWVLQNYKFGASFKKERETERAKHQKHPIPSIPSQAPYHKHPNFLMCILTREEARWPGPKDCARFGGLERPVLFGGGTTSGISFKDVTQKKTKKNNGAMKQGKCIRRGTPLNTIHPHQSKVDNILD